MNSIIQRQMIVALSMLVFLQAPAFSKASDSKDFVNHSIPKQVKKVLKPSEVRAFGSAKKTRWQKVSSKKAETFLIAVGMNDDVIAALYEFVKAKKIKGAHFTAIGAVGAIALGFYDRKKNVYEVNKVPKQLEIVSLSGNVSTNEAGKPMVHSHAVVSKRNGSCVGGHVIYATAWPTLEILLTVTEDPLVKYKDAGTGLSLFRPTEKNK